MLEVARVVAAVATWTVSAALMVGGTIDHNSNELMLWGIYVALAACMVTGWIVADCAVERGRVRVDALVRAVVQQLQSADGDQKVTRI